MSKGNLFVISGASGVGKTSVLKKVLEQRSDLQFSVSATSRPPRPGEVDGVNYYFVSREAFRDMIDRDEFVEHDYHMENYYGTLKSEVLKKTENGNMILDVEPNGALNIRKIYPQATLIFVAPPASLEEASANTFAASCAFAASVLIAAVRSSSLSIFAIRTTWLSYAAMAVSFSLISASFAAISSLL